MASKKADIALLRNEQDRVRRLLPFEENRAHVHYKEVRTLPYIIQCVLMSLAPGESRYLTRALNSVVLNRVHEF